MTSHITMSDVAREAGVSLMTVSRVVNGKGEVSPATRQRVAQVIERLGYRPSGIARGLVTRRTGTLGLVVPDIANPFFSEVARGAEHVAHAQGYNVFLCNTEEDMRRESAVLGSLQEKRVDGIVLCSSRLDDSELQAAVAQYTPLVLVNRQIENGSAGTVLVDDEAGGQIATQHLLQTGRRTVGLIAGPPTSHSGRLRVRGYRAALAAAGLGFDPALVLPCSPVVEGGQEAARALLKACPSLTGLFCYNDLVAVGALQTCVELGWRVPDDLAIVGFDDIPLAALVTPPLTTCHVPRYELGARAVRLLLSQIDGRPTDCQDIVVQPELVVRASAPWLPSEKC